MVKVIAGLAQRRLMKTGQVQTISLAVLPSFGLYI
jgi:hypothetical protein